VSALPTTSQAATHTDHACPFIDLDDERCNDHFTLGHLSQAFGACFGNYESCPNYYRLAKRHPGHLVRLTHHGRTLKPTGS